MYTIYWAAKQLNKGITRTQFDIGLHKHSEQLDDIAVLDSVISKDKARGHRTNSSGNVLLRWFWAVALHLPNTIKGKINISQFKP